MEDFLAERPSCFDVAFVAVIASADRASSVDPKRSVGAVDLAVVAVDLVDTSEVVEREVAASAGLAFRSEGVLKCVQAVG